MPKDETTETSKSSGIRRWFEVPGPVRQLFDRFPLVTYPANQLPGRSPDRRNEHALYIFTTRAGARYGEPSFNPSCLKWQAYLKFASVKFHTVPSNNHSAPTGALPFLLPAASETASSHGTGNTIPSNKLQKWVNDRGPMLEEPEDLRYDAYMTLLDYRIRNAWLYALYLEPSNFNAIAQRLYVLPCSTNAAVRATIAYQLRAAAQAELLKQSSVIDVDDLYSEADKAFEALSTLLGDDTFFFHNERPVLFDACVFAYTHLLLSEKMGWKEPTLRDALKKRENLVRHQQVIYDRYFYGYA